MGLFSGKTVYSVSTSTTRVIDDDHLPNTYLRTVLKSIMGDTRLVSEILDSYSDSLSYKVDRFAREVARYYPDGVMKSEVTSNTGNPGRIKAAIEKDLGQTVTLEYATLAPLNYNHVVWQHLTEEYAYDRESNTLGSLEEEDEHVYLDGFTIFLPTEDFIRAVDTEGTTSFGDSPTRGYTPERAAQKEALAKLVANAPTTVEITDDALRAEVDYVRVQGDTSTSGRFTLALDGEEGTDMECYQAMYQTDEGYGYWTYRYGEGRHPSLDTAYEVSYVSAGNYLPVLYLRNDHHDLTRPSNEGTPSYDAAVRACDILGLDYAEIGDAINQNEDIDSVRTAFLMFAAPLDTDSQPVMRYLYTFFSDLQHRAYPAEYEQSRLPRRLGFLKRGSLSNYVTLNIAPAHYLGDHYFGAQMNVTCQGIERTFRAGRVAAVGEYHMTSTTRQKKVSYKRRSIHSDDENTYETAWRTVDVQVLTLEYQQTSATYVRLEVQDPVLRHRIDGSGRGTNNPLGDGDWMIPIDASLIEGWSQRDREALYAKSMHMVFNARNKQHVSWYETGFFQFVMIAAAIVITIYTWGSTWETIVAAAAAGAAALALTLLTIIVKAVVINYAFKFTAKELGADIALVLAVVAAIYGGYQGFQAGSLENAPWASEALMVSTGLAKAAEGQYQADMLGLQSDYTELQERQSSEMASVQEAQSLLDTSGLLDPFSVMDYQPLVVFGEDPDSFYQRTAHSGNIGVVGIDAVTSYVDIALQLPDISRTTGGATYG